MAIRWVNAVRNGLWVSYIRVVRSRDRVVDVVVKSAYSRGRVTQRGAEVGTVCRAVVAWSVTSGYGPPARSVTAAPSCSSSVRFVLPALCLSTFSHGDLREAYLPAQCPPALQEARLPRPHEYPRRSRRTQVSARQGPRPPVRLIGRIRTRGDFERLRRDGRRVRIEPFWCSHLSDPLSNPPRVAFAISRAVGNAVIRNRLRRRLRAIVTDLDIPPGLYLIGCRPTASELSFDQIVSTLDRLPAKVQSTP